MLRWVKTLKSRIEISRYGGRPITGVDLQPVKYGTSLVLFLFNKFCNNYIQHQTRTIKACLLRLQVSCYPRLTRLGVSIVRVAQLR